MGDTENSSKRSYSVDMSYIDWLTQKQLETHAFELNILAKVPYLIVTLIK